jgi:hypothetical protein
MTDYYKNLLDRSFANSASKASTIKSSIDWFREAVSDDDGKNRGLLKRKTTLHTNAIVPGQMYFFGYDAKHKDTLPYWDAFPLIFPLDDQGPHFLGLNMHYLQPNLRSALFDKLVTDDKGNRASQMARSYNTLKSAAKFQLFQPCLKRYLKSHMTSRFIHVPPEAWEDALFLPVADWRNATHATVWKKSRRK